jgi:hypothetical protein
MSDQPTDNALLDPDFNITITSLQEKTVDGHGRLKASAVGRNRHSDREYAK